MSKRELGVVFFIGAILRWYEDRGMCWRHGCLMQPRFSKYLPATIICVMICPECEAEVLLTPRMMPIKIEPVDLSLEVWRARWRR